MNSEYLIEYFTDFLIRDLCAVLIIQSYIQDRPKSSLRCF